VLRGSLAQNTTEKKHGVLHSSSDVSLLLQTKKLLSSKFGISWLNIIHSRN
jgi:hypothetical protein